MLSGYINKVRREEENVIYAIARRAEVKPIPETAGIPA